ncbi:MAG TPA: DUF4112 domain-containing protein [Pedobacter sp.]|nr:DUF4112 domain-containing protein [Pedobacter sp.]
MTNQDEIPKMQWVSRLSYLMDKQFKFPGTNFRFGLDPLLNLIPIAGDMTGLLISGGLLMAMVRRGASNKVVILMTLNILLDATIGAIPIVGQIFDFFFKANSRNIKLMREHYLENKHQGSGKGVIIWAIIIIVILLASLIYGLWNLGAWLIDKF